MKNFFWSWCFLITATLLTPYSSYAYHSKNYAVNMCDACHPGGPGNGNFPNCFQCHNVNAPPYSTDVAPEMATHSSAIIGDSAYGLWGQTCLDCHNPHHPNGMTKDGGLTDPDYKLVEFYGSYKETVGDVTTLLISALTVHDPAWADPATWSAKSGSDRGLVLLASDANDLFWYKVLSATATEISFLNTGTGENWFYGTKVISLVYGQFINDEINGTSVVFGGPKTMATNDGLDGGDDSTPNGVCQVCHTQTLFWRNNGTRATHFSGAKCTSCHDHTQGFKAAGDCQSCHMTPDPDTNDYIFGNGVFASINATEWQTSGHGSTSNYAVSGNPGAGLSCAYCHDNDSTHDDADNPFRLANIDGDGGANGVCLACHATAAVGYQPPADESGSSPLVTGTVEVDSTHFGLRHSDSAGGGFCWDCHDPHGDSNVYMVHDEVSKESDDLDFGVPLATVPTTFSNNATGTDYATSTAPYEGICQVCHTATNHYTDNFGDGHSSNMRCTLCHKHNGGDADNAFRRPGPPIQDAYALKSRNGVSVNLQLDMSDTITMANGAVYAAGPAYSPKQTCGSCHDYNAITKAYHFTQGVGIGDASPEGVGVSDHWSDENQNGTPYKYLANAYGHLLSSGQYGAW